MVMVPVLVPQYDEVSFFTSASQFTYSKKKSDKPSATGAVVRLACASLHRLPLTCYPGHGFIWGSFRRWLRSSSRWRRLSV